MAGNVDGTSSSTDSGDLSPDSAERPYIPDERDLSSDDKEFAGLNPPEPIVKNTQKVRKLV